jgi:hypothetical protein
MASEENMRVIAIGCEYTGVTTLLDGLMDWGHGRDINHHLDDHFTIPDRQHLAPEDKETMVNLSPALKERFQRMQLVYHIRLLHRFDHILLGGFHIEEAIYGPLYYYPGGVASEIRQYEEEMPKNAILVHLIASLEVIQRRMETDPHEYSLIKKEDIPMILHRFQQEFDASLIRNKIQIDTSDLAPDALLRTFLSQSARFVE